jgi:hypothetical protein
MSTMVSNSRGIHEGMRLVSSPITSGSAIGGSVASNERPPDATDPRHPAVSLL